MQSDSHWGQSRVQKLHKQKLDAIRVRAMMQQMLAVKHMCRNMQSGLPMSVTQTVLQICHTLPHWGINCMSRLILEESGDTRQYVTLQQRTDLHPPVNVLDSAAAVSLSENYPDFICCCCLGRRSDLKSTTYISSDTQWHLMNNESIKREKWNRWK